jgi:transitional endoplasmic reticulum ATPase
VRLDDTFVVRVGTRAIEFKVIKTEPSPYCIVAPETVIHCEGEPIQREVEETLIDEIGFDDIGGLEDVKQRLKELIQYSTEHQEIYQKFGMAPSRGVLLYGPSGCGKFF